VCVMQGLKLETGPWRAASPTTYDSTEVRQCRKIAGRTRVALAGSLT